QLNMFCFILFCFGFGFGFGQTKNANNPTFGKCNASTGILQWILSNLTESAFNCAKKVIEACIKTRCGIPSEVVQLSEKKPFQQTPEMKKCWEIVRTFQELTEDADITNLMQEYQKIVYKRQIERNLRIYVCEPETNVTSISLKEDKDAECGLQQISSTVCYKDVTTVQGELTLYVQYKDKQKCFPIKADVSIFITPTRGHTPNQIEAEGVILNHLLDGVKDVDTLQFVLHAQKDIELVISRGLALSKQELEKRKKQFDAAEMNLPLALQHLLLRKWKSECLKNNRDIAISFGQWSSWKWFEVISSIFEQCHNKLPPIVCDVLINDIRPYINEKPSKWDLFFLIPCLNYLSLSTANNTSMINISQYFKRGKCSEWKEDDLDKKLISVLKTDLRIRKLNVIGPKYSEEYVLDLLIVQKDRTLSQSILEFLFLQDKDVWDHVCSSDNADKCWEVMLIAFQADFEQWDKYLKQLNELRVFEGGKLGHSFLSKFSSNTEFIQLVASSKNFLAFLPFVQQQKMM
ncbi:hypothetical protein RFI_35316, partial [Reticulomyxa filosa]